MRQWQHLWVKHEALTGIVAITTVIVVAVFTGLRLRVVLVDVLVAFAGLRSGSRRLSRGLRSRFFRFFVVVVVVLLLLFLLVLLLILTMAGEQVLL